MSYNELTDFEINKLVAEKLTGKESIFVPDYCNNPSDAWPIILENNIKLYIDDEYDDVGNLVKSCNAYTGTQANSNTEYGKFNIHHKNPLRAAMIVYLMMNKEA